eukprot:12234194-Alexandrium_andersonii.AAC.1
MGLLEVVPEPPERPTPSGSGPLDTKHVDSKNPLNANMAQNTNLKKHVHFKDSLNPKAAQSNDFECSLNSNLSGKNPLSGR